ncbi:MAG TPA: hypothetical protein VFL99_10230 [Segeticoccus sp.]|uniref:hypothetical protein n=1 Tax=Segeticoccus sp. TaxID=2706531 RepID=UPI002D7EB941|nr:hypothetical protein [Segeticoccus sp.]HET8600692.1 hypothetical protein [Segeticoccus sp.]
MVTAASRRSHGLLLSRGPAVTVTSWARRGVVPVRVHELEPWVAVVPDGPSAARPPYDESLRVLAARPVASRMRPSVGCFVIDRAAVVTVHPPGWRPVQRWVLWHPDHGVARVPDLPLARPGDIARAVGAPARTTEGVVRDALRTPAPDALTLLEGLMEVLRLPGFRLLAAARGAAAVGTLVEPEPRHVDRFERTVHHEAFMRAELEDRL